MRHPTLLCQRKKTVECKNEGSGETVELKIEQTLISQLPQGSRMTYLSLVAESSSIGRNVTRVLLSQHRGYIFIQTDQPAYKPTDKVQYRIFTLDHTFKPSDESFYLSLYNAARNRVMKSTYVGQGGLLTKHFVIPDVAKTGIWKITAHYQGDEAHPFSREFKVLKFVMPSFEVNIEMEHKYVLLKAEEFSFRILARYSYGNSVTGAYHCQFGVIDKGSQAKPVYIKGMELTGSVKDGIASISLNTSKLNTCLQNQLNINLSDLESNGQLLYLGVFVTNIQSGEIQEREVSIPVVSHRYSIDLSRTRSHFIPGYPIDTTVFVRLPDGSPAEKVEVTMSLMQETKQVVTDQQGAVFYTFNLAQANVINFIVSIDDVETSKQIKPVSSPTDTYLYLSVYNKQYTVGDSLKVLYKTKNAPVEGFIYYLVLSRGTIVSTGSLPLRETSAGSVAITNDMVPSFRLIGYFYNQHNDIISDSVWLSVKDNCEQQVTVETKGPFAPRSLSKLEINLHGKEATVGLLAVDRAFYSLNADNKLTPEQVYSSMEAYDLGCSYGGGQDAGSVLVDAGLAFLTKYKANWRRDLNCLSTSRQTRSVDLQQEMITLKSTFPEETLQNCCVRGFLLLPMKLTCEERVQRVSEMQSDPACTEAFRTCCLEGERLRKQKAKEEAQSGLGRTASLIDIEDYFMNTAESYLRKHFSTSFVFTTFNVKNKISYALPLPDSITTWEIQVVTLSKTTGLCVNTPTLLRAFKPVFVSLRLPHSVKKYEQMFISPVIYNYGSEELHVAVHMDQTEGLCSPGSATSTSFVNITVAPDSSQFVSFSAVPMRTGNIPIKIRLYDIANEVGIDAIEKTLNVWTEGIEKSDEATEVIHLSGRNEKTHTIDGYLPDDTVPDSTSNIFVSLEEEAFGSSHVRNLLSPKMVAPLIILPTGCLEQTTSKLAPAALAFHYLDMSDQWFTMPAGARDDALNKIGKGVDRIVEILNPNRKASGSFGSWPSQSASTWLTSHVLKVLSLLTRRQLSSFGREGRKAIAAIDEIRQAVRYLHSKQEADGSFGDAHPVLHRDIVGIDKKASMTAFVTLALNNSLELLEEEDQRATEAVILKATNYLWSNFKELSHPYSVAITAYSLSVRRAEDITRALHWSKFEAKDNTALNVETSAYALLTAVALQERESANKLAKWLTKQENYHGGFKSSQDTLITLEALAEYELMQPLRSESNIEALFTVNGKRGTGRLQLENSVKVETNLKTFVGNTITAQFKGKGQAKLKVLKVYHLMQPKDACDRLSIQVTVSGKVKYTPQIQENYEYYDYDDTTTQNEERRVTRSAIEWFDVRTRSRRDVNNEQIADDTVTYEVCVMHSPSYNLTGMAIADITLLSGFEADVENLDSLKTPPEQYISHYEVSNGKVLLYLNELVEKKLCIKFDAKQLFPIGLLQPAPAVLYDYYEPSQKCTIFYSAPKRSKIVSKLCSGDVCQCAERPCHKLQNTFKHSEENRSLSKDDRHDHVCFDPIDDYAYIVRVLDVSESNNFELYNTKVINVLKQSGDVLVKVGSHRVFAKRRQCKSKLNVGTEYLLMGKDGSTTDSRGKIQYLLESSTWVEPKPRDCEKTANRPACKELQTFIETFNGCKD